MPAIKIKPIGGQRSWFLAISVLVLLVSPSLVNAQALTGAQTQVLQEGILFFDTEVAGSATSNSGTSSCALATLPAISDASQVASAIDKFVQDNGGKGSPFDGLGSHIVAGSQRAGVNPFLVAAQALKESSFGVHIPPGSFNAFGRSATTGQPAVQLAGRSWYKWSSWAASVDSADDEQSLIKSVYIDAGLIQIIDLVSKYAPASDGNNPTNYAKQITGWMQEMAANAGTAVDCGQGSTGGGASAPGSPTGNAAIGKQLAAANGWGDGTQWQCLYTLWQHESGWNEKAGNPSSGAYGIPQSLPASKMASAGSDYRTNPATQIKWGLSYIQGRYQNPCNAWALWQSRNPHWY